MAEIVNLRQARKQQARADKERQAQENRIRFGRTKAETRLAEATKSLERRRLDGAQVSEASKTSDTPDGERQ